ncbi:MAG: glycosyl hydrolase 115 family protein, partial [Butyrivibrio sp.]|nr:glycosyl hydrolase 115 family protein [Butyrivibrio sp.]
GRLMSDLMLEQYKLVKKSDPDAVCCTNLYGETMELYRDGYLSFPEDVIKIWADNGFGRMVSRRQGNHNPRVYALPKDGDNGLHGIYYHASFYDLQAAAQMTMLPNSPEFVVKELQNVYSHGVDDFWIINCSNVKPHTYILDLIADMWRTGEAESAGDIEKSQAEYAEQHLREYCLEYYGRGLDEKVLLEIENLYELWPKYCIQYGPNEDDHAGEQFSNHGARILTCAFISNFCKDKPLETRGTHDLDWVCRADTLAEQVAWFEKKYKQALEGYTEYLSKCNEIKKLLESSGKTETAKILDDNLICQVEYHYYSYKGAYHALRAMEICLGDNEKTKFATQSAEIANGNKIDYISAFYEAGLSSKAFFDGYETMRSHEHGIWKNFYRNDCEADIRQSGYVLKSLMSYLRVLGDGPHFYKWQRIFQKESGGDKVHLILRVKEHLTDEEIWELMDELFS